MNNPELRNDFLGLNTVPVLKFFDADPGWKKFGSGMRKFESSARIYRPNFHENKPKTLVFT